jgi:hypothetical protein
LAIRIGSDVDPATVDRPGSSDGAGGGARRRKMRFLSMIRINEKVGQVPSEQLMHDMGKLIDDMTREGVVTPTECCEA